MNLLRLPAIQSTLNKWIGTEHRHEHCGDGPTLVSKSLASQLMPGDIALDAIVTGRGELLEEIGQHMQWAHGIPKQSVVSALAHREQIGSTALGQGVAIPHARITELDQVQLMYLRLKFPIPFDTPDGSLVSDVMVILVPKQAAQEHLQILAQVSQKFSDARFRAALHRCTQPAQVKQLFDSWPNSVRA